MEGPLALEILSIAHMDGVIGPSQSFLGLGDADQVDMIGHEAASPDVQGMTDGILLEPSQKRR